MRRSLLSLGCLLAGLLAPRRAEAHGLEFDTRFTGERVVVEAYYDDDTPVRQAKVRVEDGAQLILVEGFTDADGHWSFARPRPGVYRVIVDAGAGHRRRRDLTVPGESESARAVDVPNGDRPHRAEFMHAHWPQIALGLAVIVGVAVAARGLLRWRRRRP